MQATLSRNGHTPHNLRFTVPSPNGDNGSATAAAPSANGVNGPPAPGEAPSANGDNGRDARGRFAPGNRCGRGNPFARRVARLRTLLLEVISEEDLRAVLVKMVERARDGDLAAAKLLLTYLIGRPVEAVDPDRLDLEEWQLLKEAPDMIAVVQGQRNQLDPGMAAGLAQFYQDVNQDHVIATVKRKLEAPKVEGEGETLPKEPPGAPPDRATDYNDSVPELASWDLKSVLEASPAVSGLNESPFNPLTAGEAAATVT